MSKGTKPTAKATMVAEKDHAIVLAARSHFLRDGFAGASMDAIAGSAGVSVKTIYSHFANKDELFSRVMVTACKDNLLSGAVLSNEALLALFPWFEDGTQRSMLEAGREYLQHLLSEEQLALYRVVTRDADRFPELGRQYQENIARGRAGIMTAFLKNTYRKNGWKRRDARKDAALYEALLRAGIFEEALHGLLVADANLIEEQARSASRVLWQLLIAADR
jgi:AcrR family transcriptional regulator